MGIFRLEAPVKSYIWGGERLAREYGKVSVDGGNISETWELSFDGDSPSVVASGAKAGMPLPLAVGRKELGTAADGFEFFPVLVKLIDAGRILSVQVHPDDGYAMRNEGRYGKDEMWHILRADEGSFIYLGLKHDMTRDEFGAVIADGSIEEHLNRVPVKPGDTYFIKSGTLHAIGAGITLCEVQENSTLTYRVYDFGRLGKDGRPRELHVKKALDVVNLHRYEVPDPKRGRALLGACDYFSAYRLSAGCTIGFADSFAAVTVVRGEVKLGELDLRAGESAFIPAGESAETSGDGEFILTTVGATGVAQK